jgi:hypothetical protein
MKTSIQLLSAALLLTGSARAQYVWNANFDNNQIAAGMTLRGDAAVADGALSLTSAAEGQLGDAVLPKFWPEGETIAAFTLSATVKLNGNAGGVIGDGFSVSMTSGIPAQIVDEKGFGNGPKFSFDTWADAAVATDGGAFLYFPNGLQRSTTSAGPNKLASIMGDRQTWQTFELSANCWAYDGQSKWRGTTLVNRTGSSAARATIDDHARLILGARTGAAFNAHQFDNLSVTVTPYPVFIEQPAMAVHVTGQTALFRAQTNFNILPWRGDSTAQLAQSVEAEWQGRHPGGDWVNIPDSAGPLDWGAFSYPKLLLHNLHEDQPLWEGDDPSLPADGTEFRCVLRWRNGYKQVSQPAALCLIPLPGQQPGVRTQFNAVPRGTAGMEPSFEGMIWRLTHANPGELGGFSLQDLKQNAQGQPQIVQGLTARFLFRGDLATTPRADGFSVNLATDLPELMGAIPANAGEEGAGSGLTLSFDAFENAPQDRTGIEIRWRGTLLHRTAIPADDLFPDNWQEVFLRLEPDGTLDLLLNDRLIAYNLPLPGWIGLPEPKLAFYGRTSSHYQQQDITGLAVSVIAVPVPSTTTPPDLQLAQAGPQTMEVSWPQSAGPAWRLQFSLDLSFWQENPYPVTDSGGRRVVYYHKEASQFFRLLRQ